MKTIELADIEDAKLSESEQFLIDLIRTNYPHLDLRLGTALRDLLVRPDAIIHAWFSSQAEEQRAVASLKILLDRANNGEAVDTDDVERVLSNFNLVGAVGSSAKGIIRIVVSSKKTYVLRAGLEFNTLDGKTYKTGSQITAEFQPIDGEVRLYQGSKNFFFFVPVTCTEVGSDGNITKGTVLSPKTSFAGFVSAAAYNNFSGGSDIESLGSLVSRIPVALSTRCLLSSRAVEAVLRDEFDQTENPIIAVSSVGYGNPAQLRDKHNPFGIGVGGRVDVYVRNFTAPNTVSLRKDFTYDPDADAYVCEVSAADAPGLYSVIAVSDVDSVAISSYSFSAEYSGAEDIDTWHDLDTSGSSVELAGTVWRKCRVFVYGLYRTEDTRTLNVEAIVLPAAQQIQAFLDDESVRNVGSDFVVRCPAVCRVSINAVCRYKLGTLFDVEEAKTALANFINTTGFVGRITRSEVACVLKEHGATSVDISDNYMLVGVVVDAEGETHNLSGDSLDISDIAIPGRMLTKDTCVFSTAEENINITAIPE